MTIVKTTMSIPHRKPDSTSKVAHCGPATGVQATKLSECIPQVTGAWGPQGGPHP